MSGEQALYNLEIKKKSGLNLNPNTHHSKVFSSGKVYLLLGDQSIIIDRYSSSKKQQENFK